MTRFAFHRLSVKRATVLLFSCLVTLFVYSSCSRAGEFVKPVREELEASLRPMMPLEAGWRHPPRIARTRVWWWWLNGNVTKQAITRDLEAMKAQGIGGANIIDAGGDTQRGGTPVPHGPVFASDKWAELFKHAVTEAERLDLELGFNIMSGWNLGGPFVTLEHSSKKLTYAETTAEGGKTIDLQLPQPQARDNYYRDVAVVAIPIGRPGGSEAAGLPSAGSAQKEHPAELAADGNPDTFWVSAGKNPGQGPSAESPERLEIRFGQPTRIDRIEVVPRKAYGPKAGRIEIAEGKQWKVVRDNVSFPDKVAEYAFDPVTTQAVRLVLTQAYDPNHPDNPRNVQIAELTVRHGAKTISPASRTKPGKLKNFEMKAYHRYPGSFTATAAWHLLEPGEGSAACEPDQVVDLTDKLAKNGRLRWQAPAGTWRIIRLGYTYSGSHVSTCSEGWNGRCIDYLDRRAFDFYWDKVVEPLLAQVKPQLGKSLRFLHTDSWELGPINWTPKMPEQFRKRRGYDLTPWIPALAGYIVESPEASTRFLNDFRATLADLINENKYLRFSERAHAHGLGIHPESGGPHAGPFDALRNLGINDIPMGEFWNRNNRHRVKDTQRFFVKQTASAAHVYGRRLCMAEAFTTIGPHWERSPRMLKHDFDRAVCEGHNLTMWHTFDCSPQSMGLPGQVYFAGTHANPQVTWWPMIDGFIAYMNRVQFMMQQGLAVSDVLYYVGENIPAFVRLKRDDPAGVLPGYDYDAIDTQSLIHRLTVDADGYLTLPHGIRYRVLALPAYDAYDLPTLEKIASLVERGAIVCGRKPERRYGLSGDAAADQRFAQLVKQLWGSGKITDKPTRQVLADHRIAPDFTWTEAEPVESKEHQLTIDMIHKRTDEADVYFVANRLNVRRRITASFRQSGRQPELWNPITGEIVRDAAYLRCGDRIDLELDFAPEDSVLVVFRTPATNVKPRATNLVKQRNIMKIDGPWTVTFDPQWGPKEPVRFNELKPWNEHSQPLVKYFSGIATYRKTFEFDGKTSDVYLDLGEVREVARVKLNGKDLGVVWYVPARIEIGSALKEGTNQLEIEVANNWPNRMIGDQNLPQSQRRTKTNFQKFKKDHPLFDSGLLGPVNLIRIQPADR